MERIAVLSDVHGNMTAFDAVLRDLDARGIDTVLNLGDVVGKGPRGSAAVARSRERCAVRSAATGTTSCPTRTRCATRP